MRCGCCVASCLANAREESPYILYVFYTLPVGLSCLSFGASVIALLVRALHTLAVLVV